MYICESQRDGYSATTETEPPPTSLTAPCPENWLGFRDKCYKVSNFYESSYVSSKEQPILKKNSVVYLMGNGPYFATPTRKCDSIVPK